MVIADFTLISSHLIPKLKHPNKQRRIKDVDVYKFEPWVLVAEKTDERDFCFYIRETEIRSNAHGFWVELEGVDNEIDGEEFGTIGTKRAFQYHILQNGKGVATRWFNYEYELDEDFQAEYNLPKLPIRICQIQKVENYPLNSEPIEPTSYMPSNDPNAAGPSRIKQEPED